MAPTGATLGLLGVAMLAATPARATLLQAIHPGVMCEQASALAQLSLPNGGSRLDRYQPSPAAAAIARAGGCVDFETGRVVMLVSKRHDTSVVHSSAISGDAGLDTVVIPNVDFAPYSPPRDPSLDTVRAMCPAHYETFVVLGIPAYDFIQSLPPAIRDGIDKAVDDRCGGAPRCSDRAIEDEISRRGLARQRVAFACRHPV